MYCFFPPYRPINTDAELRIKLHTAIQYQLKTNHSIMSVALTHSILRTAYLDRWRTTLLYQGQQMLAFLSLLFRPEARYILPVVKYHHGEESAQFF